jgi:hypothetical protein
MRSLLLGLVLTTTVIISMSVSALAQSRGSGSRPTPGEGVMRDRELQQRSIALEHMADSTKKEKQKDPKLAYAEIKEDFVKLQETNNVLLEAAFKSLPEGPDPIEKAAAEITRRAERLKVNLVLPLPSEDSHQEEAGARFEFDGDLLKGIKALDEHITAFVTNPLFRNPRVLDSKKAMDASAELEQVIDASKSLRRSAEKLKKQTARE